MNTVGYVVRLEKDSEVLSSKMHCDYPKNGKPDIDDNGTRRKVSETNCTIGEKSIHKVWHDTVIDIDQTRSYESLTECIFIFD